MVDKEKYQISIHLIKNLVEAEKRAMINMPIQGTASELIKVAMINIHRIFNENQ